MFNDFSRTIREKLMKKSSTNGMNCSLNSLNLGQDITQYVKLETLLAPPLENIMAEQSTIIVFNFFFLAE